MENISYDTLDVRKSHDRWTRPFVFVDNTTLDVYKGNVINNIDDCNREEDTIGIQLIYASNDLDHIPDEIHEWIVEKELESLNHCDCLKLEYLEQEKKHLLEGIQKCRSLKSLARVLRESQADIQEELS